MAIAVAETVTGSITTGDTVTVTSWTPGANELILVSVAMRATGITPTVAGNGLTFVSVADVVNVQTQARTVVFRAMGASPSTGSVTVTVTGNTNPVGVIASRFSGIDTSGTNGSGACEAVASDDGPSPDDNDMLVAVTTATADAWAWAAGSYRNRTFTVPSGQTIIKDDLLTGGVGGEEANSSTWYVGPVATPAATTVGALNDLSGTTDWIIIAVSIKPASGAGAQAVTLGLLDAGPALYAPTLVGKNTVVLGLLDAAGALYAPSLATRNLITLALLDAGPALYAPTLAPQPVTIVLGLLDAAAALYAPTLVGKNLIALGLLDSGSALYAPVLATRNLISLGLLDASAALYAPTLTQPSGAQAIVLGLLDGAAALYAPTLVGKNLVALGLLDASPALYAPTLTKLNTITLGLLDAAGALYAPTLAQGAGVVTVTLVLLDSGAALYAPTLALDYERVDPRIRRMMSNKNRGAWFNRR